MRAGSLLLALATAPLDAAVLTCPLEKCSGGGVCFLTPSTLPTLLLDDFHLAVQGSRKGWAPSSALKGVCKARVAGRPARLDYSHRFAMARTAQGSHCSKAAPNALAARRALLKGRALLEG